MLNVVIPTNGHRETDPRVERGNLPIVQTDWSVPVYAPRADVMENADEMMVRLEMPGLRAGDFDIKLEQDVLTVKALRKEPERKSGELFHRSELAYGTLARAFSLPAHVKPDGVKAVYENGILTVTLPKAEESKPRTIEVRCG